MHYNLVCCSDFCDSKACDVGSESRVCVVGTHELVAHEFVLTISPWSAGHQNFLSQST